MGELIDIDGQIDTALQNLRAHVSELEGLPDEKARKDAIAAAKRERVEVNRLISTLRAALRATTDKLDKQIYEKKRLQYDSDLKALLERINDAAAIGGAATTGAAAGGRRRRGKDQPLPPSEIDGNELATANEVLAAAAECQTTTIDLGKKVLRTAAATNEIGLNTLQTLQKQTEIIMAADDTLDGLDSNLKRASRQVQAIARKMAGDKCFLGMFCLLVLALCLLIFWKIFDARRKGSDPAPTDAPVVTLTEPPVTLLRGFAHQ